MTLRDEIYALWNSANKADGEWFGKLYTITRPDYTATGASNIIQSESFVDDRMFRAEAGSNYSEPNVPEVLYYTVKGNINNLQVGDVLTDKDGIAPTLTIINADPMKDTKCIRTSRVGSIYTDINSPPVVDKIRYEWMTRSAFMAGPDDVLNAIEGKPAKKIAMYGHSALLPQNFWVQGMRLLETDGTLSPNKRWMIKFVESISPILIFHVEEES